MLPFLILSLSLLSSVMSDSATLWTVAHQAPLSMGFFRQEYWSGLPFPTPGDLPDPGIQTVSLASPALAGGFFTSDANAGDTDSIPSLGRSHMLWCN